MSVKISRASLKKIHIRSPFSDLFPTDPKVASAVRENMNLSGYDYAYPITIWRDENILIDGHTRVSAAKSCGLDVVPAIYRPFEDTQQALDYAIHVQRNRRNLTDADILRCVDEIDKLKAVGRPQKLAQHCADLDNPDVDQKKGKSAAETAEKLGTSTRKVEQVRNILDHGDEDTIQDVKDGKKSINAAHKETTEKKNIEGPAQKSLFNKTTDSIEWAKWTWNPVTGCLGPAGEGTCDYCYAKDIANHYPKAFPNGFEPTFHEHRLEAPRNQKIPDSDDTGDRNVFVCSMADLFGAWVPQEWIDKVMHVVRESAMWNFIFLTKNPQRMVGVDFPSNAWVGTTVDTQARVAAAENAFASVKANIKFVSCEPLLEPVTFNSLDLFDWVIIGGRSKSSGMPEGQPEWGWVEQLLIQSRAAGCQVYFKPNLIVRPMEYPTI